MYQSYRYDTYNRLTAALYQEPNSTLPQNGFYNETMNYDANGNISNLKRNQKGYNGFLEEIDDLVYNYQNTNRMISVVDHKNNYSGYPDTSGNTISYDLNGNMSNHLDKGVLEIKYNDFNLPKYIKFNKYVTRIGGNVYSNTTYSYRADGVKTKKIHYYFSGKTKTDAYRTTEYIDGFQYKTETALVLGSNGLQFFATSEGYFDFVNNRYIYHYNDHLGNVRVSFARVNNTATIIEKSDYYAFGLKHGGNFRDDSGVGYNYEYNGKEMQEEIGMYDYGARFYMPDLGRWGVVDPLAEQMRRHSPYNYAYNNPITFIDPDGRRPEAGQSGIYYDWDEERYIDMNTGLGSNFDAAMAYSSSNSNGANYMSFYFGGGSGGGGGASFLQGFFGNGNSVNSLFSLVDQLKTVWKDPANTKAKFEDASKISEISAIKDLVLILNYVANQKDGSNIFFEKTNNWLINGQSRGYKILLNMNNISSVLELAYVIGHETNHSITSFFSNTFYKTVGSKGPLGQNAFSYFTELISYSWEESWGSTHRNLNASDYTYLMHGPNSPVIDARHSQLEVDLVNNNLKTLLRLYNNFITIPKK